MSTLRRPPRGPLRLLARLPIWLYRLRLGWLMGSRFLLLRHTGRRTGAARQNVLEVVHHEPSTGTYFVAAAWGDRAQWFRNVRANPDVEVTVGRRRFEGVAERVSPEEAERVLGAYAQRHRLALRGLGRLLGSSDPHVLAQTLPIVALRPRA